MRTLWWLLYLAAQALEEAGFSSFTFWALEPGSEIEAHGLSYPLMGSYRSRDQSHVSCAGQWSLYHFATREALILSLNIGYVIKIVVGVFCMLLYAYTTFYYFELV